MSESLIGEFEYEVRLNVVIPLTWATALKAIAKHHYDYKCKEAGDCGVINGLFNCATWSAKEGEVPSYMPVSWRDLDLMTKVMEQAHYHKDVAPIEEKINVWLKKTKEAIVTRHADILKVDKNWKQFAREQLAEDRS